MSIEVEVRFAPLMRWIQKITGTKPEITTRSKNRIAEWTEDRMRDEAPLGLTGALRAGIESDVFAESIEVRSTAPHTIFIVGGAKPGPGRYIPSLISGKTPYPGARLTNPPRGQWPGFPENPFVDRTHDALIENLDELLEEYLDWFMEE